MKKTALAAVMLCMAAGVSLPVKADEPCNITMCMWGMVNGSDSDGCQSQIKKFFSIKIKKKGSFRPDKTADARKDLLMGECPASMAPYSFIDTIISKFGRIS
ncbi:killer protein [Pantoea ananatis]|uniref:killer protein n=1 Tax=Pantoea ananas TaxID=553 RepID=UPI0021E76A02|nr:killer protein [Pantoea ananatis]MCW0309921.1 hypothetical protein [Pantoea ananatis]MCW0341597.1 hypothetical protein [Pantoea ananatis]MCW0360097.1 hypothetical protein [Pantoea ananatis]MCW0364760.1 hypothetical protein [Pantoea ananatis]MCW1777345.1 killer protein [Pantoea ananatis]